MLKRQVTFWAAFAIVAALAASARAQDPGKPGDEALDSLIEKLADPKKGDQPETAGATDRPTKPRAAKAAGKPAANEPRAGQTPAAKKGQAPRSGGTDVSTKDKELDDLLERLGQTGDEPAADDRERGHGAGAGEPRPADPKSGGESKPGEKKKPPSLTGDDQSIDEKLEEFSGRKRKKKNSPQDEGSGPMGQLIKEMREVEKRLGKPDTSEETQNKQKQIVKQIETLIQQMKQSGQGSGSMAMRQVRQAGQKPGTQPGQTAGANAGGAPLSKAAKPSGRSAMPNGKDIWGHLPAELRAEMDNVFKEDALPSKADLIKRYYLSVAKQKLVRGE